MHHFTLLETDFWTVWNTILLSCCTTESLKIQIRFRLTGNAFLLATKARCKSHVRLIRLLSVLRRWMNQEEVTHFYSGLNFKRQQFLVFMVFFISLSRGRSPPVPAVKHRVQSQQASTSPPPPVLEFIPYVRTDEVFNLDPLEPANTPPPQTQSGWTQQGIFNPLFPRPLSRKYTSQNCFPHC